MTTFNANAIFTNDAITSTIKAVCTRTKENYTPTEHDAEDFVSATRVRVMEVYRTSYDFEAAYAGTDSKYNCNGFEAVRKLCASIAGRTRSTVIRSKYATKRGHELTMSANNDDGSIFDSTIDKHNVKIDLMLSAMETELTEIEFEVLANVMTDKKGEIKAAEMGIPYGTYNAIVKRAKLKVKNKIQEMV